MTISFNKFERISEELLENEFQKLIFKTFPNSNKSKLILPIPMGIQFENYKSLSEHT